MGLDLAPLDGYVELRELVGAGGMGEVHAAWDARLARPVAVKLLHGEGPRGTDRLVLEARLQARVEHPNVVRVIEVGTLGGRPCIVLALVRGQTLAELASSLTVAQRVELLRQAAAGIHAAHQEGLVHRDVKPGNILVEHGEDGSPTAFVTDFGLAHAEEGGLTRSGALAGTLDFMAPEQLAGGPADFGSDIYSLGASLYAVLAGRPPFRGSMATPEDPDEQLQLVRRILDEDPPPVSRVVPEVPRELSLVCQKAMEKEPRARYPSALAFGDDLGRFLRGEPVRARAAGAAERAGKWARRNPATARVLALLAATVLVSGGLGLWQARRASLEALDAARLGAEAEALHQTLRTELLLPAHDLSPTYARIREHLARLSALPQRAGGAAAFARGRAHQLLGDHPSAYPELTMAWAQGFRRPEVAVALAEAEGALYAQELVTMGRVDDPERKKARMAELARRFRDPAAARLAELTDVTESDRYTLTARLALVDERFDDAAENARRSAEAGGDPVSAGELEGEALIWAGFVLRERGKLDLATERWAAAARVLQRAADIGRSAPGPRWLLARVRVGEFDLAANTEGFRLAPLEAIVAILREAERLDPQSGELHAIWCGVEHRRGNAFSALGDDPRPAFREAVSHAERAVAAASDPRIALLQVASSSHGLAEALADRGGDPLPTLDEGLAAARKARLLSPGASGPVFNLAQLGALKAKQLSDRGHDGRAAAAEAVANGRAFLALGDRPVTSRIILAKALESLGVALWSQGEDGEPALAEGRRLLDEAFDLSPKAWGVLEKGMSLAITSAKLALAEGRSPAAALAAGAVRAEGLRPLSQGNMYFAAAIGIFRVVEAEATMGEGRDPTALLADALSLLERPGARLSAARAWQGEAELLRASWAVQRGADPRPALHRAQAHAEAAQQLDGRDADAPLVLARALLAAPQRSGEERARLRQALERARALDPRDPLVWVADARGWVVEGDAAKARASLERAYGIQPRIRGGPRAKEAEAELAALSPKVPEVSP